MRWPEVLSSVIVKLYMFTCATSLIELLAGMIVKKVEDGIKLKPLELQEIGLITPTHRVRGNI